MGDVVRVEMKLSGRVQGVFLRQSTCDRGRQLGVAGWIRNLPDGRVEVTAEGTKPRLMDLVAFCREGPATARVDDVDVRWVAAQGLSGAFEIRR